MKVPRKPASRFGRLLRLLRILQGCFLAVWVCATGGLWYHYAATRPDKPRPETGNIYQLNTHGSYAYLTYGDCVRLYGTMGLGIGGMFVTGILDLLVTGMMDGFRRADSN